MTFNIMTVDHNRPNDPSVVMLYGITEEELSMPSRHIVDANPSKANLISLSVLVLFLFFIMVILIKIACN